MHDVIGVEGAYDCGSHPSALHEAGFGASCLPPSSSVISPASPSRRQHTMALDEAITLLAILTPIAKAVPVLGSPVEGSLEALSKLLELAKARRLALDQALLLEFEL
jgi:hypothetical protein